MPGSNRFSSRASVPSTRPVVTKVESPPASFIDEFIRRVAFPAPAVRDVVICKIFTLEVEQKCECISRRAMHW